MTDDEAFTTHPDLLLMEACWTATGEPPCPVCEAAWSVEMAGGLPVLIREHGAACPLG